VNWRRFKAQLIKTEHHLPILILVVFASCTTEEIPPEVRLSVNSFETVVPSGLQKGTSVGKLEIQTNQPSIDYTITSQIPAGSIIIDPSSGIIKVEDPTKFEFANNSSILGEVEVSAGGIKRTTTIAITVDELNAFDYEVISYFNEIALGFEFGNASEITRRWETDVNIFVAGVPSEPLTTELDLIINELNELISTNVQLSIVSNQSESNYFLFLGDHISYSSLYPEIASVAVNNWGLFSVYWNASQEINRAHMYVDTERANLLEQRHLLREELTQSLGLAKDSDRYNNSIFSGSFSVKTTNYSAVDAELIRLLYHPDMKIGLGSGSVEAVLRAILLSEK
jgi:hypothetical protein